MSEEKTVISIAAPTPMWATWLFRIVFVLTSAASIWIAATQLVSDANKAEIMLALKCLDVIVWGVGRMLGVKKDEEA